MNILETIKAEIERLKKEHQEPTFRGDEYEEGGVNGYQLALDKVLAKLDTLQEQPVCEDVEEPISKELVRVYETYTRPDYIEKDSAEASVHFDHYLARHFYELGKQSKVFESEELDDASKDCLSRQKSIIRASYTPDGELQDLYTWGQMLSMFKDGARWNMKRSKPEASEELYDFMKKRSESLSFHDDFEIAAYKEGVVDGATWQKEQMLKEAVEGYVDKDYIVTEGPSYFIRSVNLDLPNGVKDGDKGKLLFVKED